MTAYKGDRTTGFASPAAEACDGPVDLSAVLDLARPQRYLMRVTGQSLESRGVRDGDIVIVDTALPLQAGRLVIACLNETLTLATLTRDQKGWWLQAATPGVPPRQLSSQEEIMLWGIVDGLVRLDP
ncbi:LexA family protein [Neokomagataea thailandica]|uniref:SOS mutagenesis protein UmuD n=1 Tax=Neokomagataea tanensis NBRC 106556 TaxID=1223519 RepID=A0ABQ0QL36_9PROT|nr:MULTISPECIES: S24 family peptidase [Neokomagataea]GBR48722.1 SOS mutagenesis protein UmuD [Neokomagataea tanensis NBRC 106556]